MAAVWKEYRLPFSRTYALALGFAFGLATSSPAFSLNGLETLDQHNDCSVSIAAKTIEKSRAGNANANYEIALQYLHTACGDIGVTFLKRAAKSSHPEAAELIGELSLEGDFVEQDLGAAATYFRVAAEQDHIKGQRRLGMALLWDGSSSAHVQEALFWLGSAAGAGDTTAALTLGMLHQRGMHGVAQDDCTALYWYEAANLMGFPDHAGFYAKLKIRTGHSCD